jgi:hypothetical protein
MESVDNQQSSADYLLHTGYLPGSFFGPDTEAYMFLRNVY